MKGGNIFGSSFGRSVGGDDVGGGTPVVDNLEQQHRAVDVLNALHRAGFGQCWLDSTIMYRGGLSDPEQRSQQVQYSSFRVIIERDALGHDQVEMLYQIAAEHEANVTLAEIRLNQQSFSRFAIWPREKA